MSQQGDSVSIFVTALQALGKVCQIWAQTDTEACQKIETLMIEANIKLESRPTLLHDTIVVGDVLLAKFHEDGKWYRAKVKHVDKEKQTVTVFFIDYGNEEDIEVTNLAKGEEKHFEIPPQATQFVLGEIQAKNNHEWTNVELDGLKEQLVYGEFIGIVLNGNTVGSPRTIRLFTSNTKTDSLATTIIAGGFGSRANVGMEEPLEQTILEPNKSYHVYMAYYESPINFWIQLTDKEDVLNKLQDAIGSEITDASPRASHVTVGTVCVAKFCDIESGVETFYRAVVMGVHSDGTCTVLFVDYGNSEKLSLNKLKTIPPIFREIPSQAIQCCLEGSLANADQFHRMLESENIYATVAVVIDSGLHVVKLSEEQSSKQPHTVSGSKPVSSKELVQNTFSSNNNGRRTYKSLKFNVDKQIDLCISHVEPSGRFYCQLLENGPHLNQLMHILDERYCAKGTSLNIPSPGAPCVTRSVIDKCVYRSKIMDVDNDTVTVQHIDFGLLEVVPLENVLVLDEDLMDLQNQSIYCSLSGSDNLSSTAVANLLKRYESQTALVGTVMRKSGQLHEMDLVDTSSISDVYLAKELQKTATAKPRTSEQSFNKVTLKEGQWTDIQVTFIGDPANVFCQFVSAQGELNALMGQVESHCSSCSTTGLTRVETGMACLAKYSEDSAWYRAIIVGIDPAGQFDVYFVDYGNHDLVAAASLMDIPPELMILPQQCFRGVLDGLVGAAGSWSEEETTLLFQMASEESHPILVTKHEAHDDLYVIQIFTIVGSCINQKFGKQIKKLSPTFTSRGPPSLSKSQKQTSVKSPSESTLPPRDTGWAQWQQPGSSQVTQQIKPLEVQPGYKNIIIETIVNPGEFYCRLTESSETLFDFMDQLNAEYLILCRDDLQVTKVTEGMVCCAKFTNEWYRARVLSVSNDGVGVQYVDFGNTDLVPITDIKRLKPALTNMPAQALKCSLAGVSPVGEQWSEESGSVFENIMGESQMVGAFTECGNDGVYLIEVVQSIAGGQILFHEELVKCGIAISQEPQKPEVDHVLLHGNSQHQVSSSSSSSNSQSLHTSHKYSKPLITALQTVDVNVVHVETPTEFWVQLTRSSAELENLMGSLQNFYSVLGADQFRISSAKPNMACVARFSEDEIWYRAEVVRELRDGLLIRYVDYGNYEKRTLADVWEIQSEFLTFPAQAIQCRLHGVVAPPTGWANTTKDKLEDLVLDKNLLAKVLSVSSSPQILTVKLLETFLHAQRDIANWLILLKLAVSTAKTTSRQKISSGRTATETQPMHTDVKVEKSRPPFLIPMDMPPQDVAIGDTLEVNIVWANSPTSFWCQQINSQTALQELMEALSEHYETLRMKEAEIPTPQSGQLCVALYNADGNWYRSRVLRTRNREAEVIYVDFGNKDRLPWSKLKEIRPEFLDVPQMALHCTLNGMEVFNGNYDQAIEKYFLKVMAQDLSLSVQALPKSNGEAHTVTITDKEGNDVAQKIIQIGGKTESVPQNKSNQDQSAALVALSTEAHSQTLDVRAQSEESLNVTYKMLKIPEGETELIVSSIDTVDSFYCQLTANTEKLESFRTTIEAHYGYETVYPLALADIKVEMPCAAQFSEDSYWYRAKVKRIISPTKVEITFVDYANSEVTNVGKIYPLLPRFADYPVQAFHCTLAGMESISNPDTLAHFRQLVENKELLGKVMHINSEKYELLLTDKVAGTSINSIMVSTFPKDESVHISSSSTVTYLSPQLPIGNEEVYIAHVDSPTSFWVQLSSQEIEVQAFADSMQERYESLGLNEEKLVNASTNAPCVARFSEDHAWYRGTIEKISRDEATVRFIDYGNTDHVPLDGLKNIAADLLSVPPFSIHCKLDGTVEPATGWTSEHKMALEEMSGSIMAIFTPTEPLTTVKLKIGDVDVSQSFGSPFLPIVEMKYIAPSVPSGQVGVYVSHTEDGFLYVQLDDQDDDLQALSDKLHDVYNAFSKDYLKMNGVHPGDTCVAQFSENGVWYRALIESVTDQQVQVRFVDFGNGEVTTGNSLKQLKPELLNEQPFAIKCKIHGILDPTSGLPEGFKVMLEEQLLDTQVTVTFVGTQEPYTLKLVDGGEKFADEMQEKFPQLLSSDNSQICSDASTMLPKSECVKISEIVYVSSVVSPKLFFVQKESEVEALDKLMELVSTSCESASSLNNTTLGQLCCAKYSEDGRWYRGIITNVDENICVQFCDYGNSDTVEISNLLCLCDPLRQIPAFAVAYQLVGANSIAWTDKQTDQFEEMTSDKVLIINGLVHGTSPPSICLFEGDVDLNLAMGCAPSAAIDSESEEDALESGMYQDTAKEVSHDAAEELSKSLEVFQLKEADDGIEVIHKNPTLAVCSDKVTGDSFLGDISSDASEEFTDASNVKTADENQKPSQSEFRRVCLEEVPTVEVNQNNDAAGLTQDLSCSEFQEYPDEIGVPQVVDASTTDGPSELHGTVGNVNASLTKETMDTTSNKTTGEGMVSDLSSDASDEFADAVDEVEDCRALQPGDRIEVETTHIKSPSKFWCVRVDGKYQQEEMLAAVAECCESGVTPGKLVEGQTYGARHTDNQWCRICVTAVEDEQVECEDEGTEVIVPISEVDDLLPEGTSLQPQAIRCCLVGIETQSWSQEAIDFFKGFKDIKTLSAHVVAVENETHQVYLYDLADKSGISINTQLVSRGFAWIVPDEALLNLDESVLSTQEDLEESFLEYNRERRPSLGELGKEPGAASDDEGEGKEPEVLQFTTPNLTSGDVLELSYLSTVDPHNLLCQLTSYRAQFGALVEHLSQSYSTEEEAIQSIQLHSGDACLAYSDTESVWLRARVLVKEGDNIVVHFVDFGDSDTVPLENIQRIEKTAMELPALAVTCNLAAVLPVEEWTEGALAALRENCTNKELTTRIHSVEQDGRLQVSIQLQDEEDLVDKLVSEGHAVRDESCKMVTSNSG